MFGRFQQLAVKVFFADSWKAYLELILCELIVQTKSQMHEVEHNDFCQYHWCDRFRLEKLWF
jgi:IS1 family transposase